MVFGGKLFKQAPRLANDPGEELKASFQPDLLVSPIRPGSERPRDSHASYSAANRHSSLYGKPKISVVLGSLDRSEFLRLAIDSVRRELSGLAAEIIVIDGGSLDGSVAWLVSQPDIITILQKNRFEENGRAYRRKSWGAFMNIAFRAAAGRYVLMISDDCLLLPGSIKAALERTAAAEKAGLNVGACAFYFRNWPLEDRYYVQRTLGGNLMVNHGLYAKHALEAVGYANEDDYVFYKADTDLSLRIWRAGYTIIDSPGSICEHYLSVHEKLRASNNAVIDHDREQMLRLWPELNSKVAISKMGRNYLPQEPGPAANQAWQRIHDDELSKHQLGEQ